jgi:hypothetical protein
LKENPFPSAALYSLIGIFTRPKLILPFHIDLGGAELNYIMIIS